MIKVSLAFIMAMFVISTSKAQAAPALQDVNAALGALNGMSSQLSKSDQDSLNYAKTKLGFAIDSLKSNQPSIEGNFSECVTRLYKAGGLYEDAAATFCKENSSQAFVDCTLKLYANGGLYEGAAANDCINLSK